jgi:GT2 family glycosyltransferase
MNTLICPLVYGNRPLDIIHSNLENAGFPFNVKFINVEGIANALNTGIEQMTDEHDAIAFMANDIKEPENWLFTKLMALENYTNAGIIGSTLETIRTEYHNEPIISNWIIRKEVIKEIGKFNEDMFPYGPIDLDYCERVWQTKYRTYYAINYLAEHIGSHATGNEYGYDKKELVDKYWNQHLQNIEGYRSGLKSIKL